MRDLPIAFFYNIQGGQLMLIILAILLLFGTKRLPGIARGLGHALREFRKAASDIEKNLNMEEEPPTRIAKVEQASEKTEVLVGTDQDKT